MHKHFLVTISNDVEHLFGVRFVCSFFNTDPGHRITLLHICRLDSSDMNSALTAMWDTPNARVTGRLTVGARKSIDRATKLLTDRHLSVDQIFTKTVAEQYGKVKDILAESARGLYDAVILGRRAAYTLQWLFERPADETIQAMIRDSRCSSPLWICPAPHAEAKDVLVCIDGSENAFRAVDHVGYMVADQPRHAITLFHVAGIGGGETDDLFRRAEAILHGHGIGAERITGQRVWSLTVAGTILTEIDRGGYAAAAVGLHGQQQGLLKELKLAGGTTAKLISKIDKTSLWCCP